MALKFFAFILLLPLTFSCASRFKKINVESAESKPVYISGWIAYWDESNGFASLADNSAIFDEINPFNYSLDENGRIKENSSSLRKKTFALKIIPTIVNDVIDFSRGSGKLKDPAIIHEILSKPAQRKRHIKDIMGIARNFDGIDIDYENLYAGDRKLFTAFIKELAGAVHSLDKTIVVTVPQKNSENGTYGAEAMDWKKLGEYADRIRIMCYNYSSSLSGPGPLSPPDWIDRIISFAKTQIATEKITICIGLQGYDWSDGTTKSITFRQAMEKASENMADIEWDEPSCSPYLKYRDKNGKKHEVWFENAKSVSCKLEVLKKHNITNIALWRLSHEDPEIYSLLRAYKGK